MKILASNFSIAEGGQRHFFTLAPGEAESQLVVRPDSRVIAAFPAANTGVSVWFGAGAEVDAVKPPRSQGGPEGQQLTVELCSQKPELVITDAVLGSIRTIREQLQSTGEVERIERDSAEFSRRSGAPASWVETRSRHEGNVLEFTRTELDGRPYVARLTLPSEVQVTQRGEAWQLAAPGPFRFTLETRIPHAPLGGYAPEELFSPRALEQLEHLKGDPREERCLASMRSLMFLARKGKLLAGSWRFMTYFGRDTMLSLMLLQPALTPRAYADGLQSVVDRLSPEGAVAHEEDLGPWAEMHHVRQILQLPTLSPAWSVVAAELAKPVYDYRMCDDDFMLPLSTERLLNADPEVGKAFLERNREALIRNWNHVIRCAEPYAREGGWQNLIRLSEGTNKGDWRDSEEGLGWGRFPGSVSVDLVSASLRCIARMAEKAGVELPELSAMAEKWDGAKEHFRVRLTADQVRERLHAWFQSVPAGEAAFYLSRPVGEGGPTLGAFLAGAPALENGLSFMALSLDAEGKRIEIPNTDGALRLFLADPSAEEVSDILTLLEVEYPVGLMTGVGPVVSNAAYSTDPRHHRELGKQAYHGAVMWSWQSAMLQAGLVRQMERHPQLADRLQRALDRLKAADTKAGSLATSELWTHDVSEGEWKAARWSGGDGSDAGDESNAAQLWSTVYPAILMRTG